MKNILIHTSIYGNNNKMFDPNVRDGFNDPAIYLRERLHSLGYSLKTSDNHSLHNCAYVFFWSTAGSVTRLWGLSGWARRLKDSLIGTVHRNLYRECILAGLEEHVVFFLVEGPAVTPDNWDPRLHSLFPVIFTWHNDFVDGQKFHKICLPQTRQFPEVLKIPFGQRKLLVNISYNKYSRHPKELYSARRATIRYFERKWPDEFDLYGVGWDGPAGPMARIIPINYHKYSSYRGSVRHKWDVLPYYRFSVCYENIRDEPGYITEKIFDSMRAGCVPIYWGAPNICEYVDAEAFIDRRQFKSEAELENYLTGISEKEYEGFQEAMRDYLTSARFARFLPPSFADTIIRVLKL